jgi:hypothetical protein
MPPLEVFRKGIVDATPLPAFLRAKPLWAGAAPLLPALTAAALLARCLCRSPGCQQR